MRIIGGMATIPARENTLKRVIESILPQVDELYVAFNGYKKFPTWVQEFYPKLHFFLTDNSMGDAEKFRFVGDVGDCYYCTFDDDLVLNKPDSVKRLTQACDKYMGSVSYHGRLYSPPITGFTKWEANFRCLNTVSQSTFVNFLGTGTACHRTDLLKISIDDFKKPNMADCYFAMANYEQGLPTVVVAHPRDQFTYLPQENTIWKSESKDGYKEQLKILRSFLK